MTECHFSAPTRQQNPTIRQIRIQFCSPIPIHSRGLILNRPGGGGPIECHNQRDVFDLLFLEQGYDGISIG